MQIVDCTTFYNDTELLLCRVEALSGFVDFFIVSESRETHTGRTKPLLAQKFLEQAREAGRLSDELFKRVFVLEADLSTCKTDWEREALQRDLLRRRAEEQFEPDALLLVNDADEFPSVSAVEDASKMLKESPGGVYFFTTFLSYFKVNYLNLYGPEAEWRGPYIIKNQPRVETLTEIRNRAFKIRRQNLRSEQRMVGWHFSYMGDEAHFQNKKKDSQHQESSIQSSRTDIQNLMQERRGPYDEFRGFNLWGCVPLEFLQLDDRLSNHPYILERISPNVDSAFAMYTMNDYRERVKLKKPIKTSLSGQLTKIKKFFWS